MSIINMLLISLGVAFLLAGISKSLLLIKETNSISQKRLLLVRSIFIILFIVFYLAAFAAILLKFEDFIVFYFSWVFALGGIFVWLSFVDLSNQEKIWDTIVKSAPDILLTLDRYSIILYANKGLSDKSVEQLVGTNILHLLPMNQRKDLDCAMRLVRESKKSTILACHFKNGEGMTQTISYQIRINLLRLGDPNGLLIISLSDLSEQNALENQLRQAQKMDAIGRLAGGVAHDFNNLLTVIGVSAEMLKDEAFKFNWGLDKIDLILESHSRASALTRQLLTFSRQEVNTPELLDLDQQIAEMKKTLLPLIGEHISFCFNPSIATGSIQADKGHIYQVILNLAINARDAMPDGGKLLIETSVQNDDDTEVKWANIKVSDTGVGMDKATQAKVFEPFFTTKAVGMGTGLGLSTVYGIIKQCGGKIELQSALGEGAVFNISLPLVENNKTIEIPKTNHQPLKRGTGSVLLVEDEVNVRVIVKNILAKNGFDVIEAENGIDGLIEFEKHKSSIKLILTDVIMPKMGGMELFEIIKKDHGEVPILFMSGYTANSMMQANNIGENMAFLSKPFSPHGLLREVHGVINDQSILN